MRRAAALLTMAAAAAGCGDGTPAGPTTPAMREARALWVNRFEIGPTPAKIAEIMRKAKDAGFNVVYFQVRGQGDAYYASGLEPCAVALCGSLGNGQPSWDPLATAVQEAHARGLQLHAWVNAFTGWASPATNTASFCALLRESAAGAPRHMLLAHPEWAMVSSGSPGTVMSCANSQAYEYAYVSPGIPAARTHLARVAADVARRYAVDGVHLDRIRYPGQFHSYDAPSLEAFRARHGRAPTSSTDDAEWVAFRQEQVNLAVREVHDSVRAARASAVMSAAVWGIYRDQWGWNSSEGLRQYYQDPRAWAAGGYLDVAVPMTYYKTAASACAFADWSCLLDDHLAGVQGAATGRHVYIGITASPLSGETAATAPARVVSQIELARARGAKGVAIYSYNAVESTGLWSVLAAGPFKQAAVVPGRN